MRMVSTAVFRTLLALTLLVIVSLFALGLAIEFQSQNPINCTFGPQGQILEGGLLRECKAEIAQRNVEWANTPAMNFTFYVIWPAMVLAIAVWFFQGLLHKRIPSTTHEDISSC